MTTCISSESVTEGHPDKVCDQISDAILDAYVAKDPMARVAAEVLASGNTLHIAGEITSTAHVDVPAVARGVLRRIGYSDPALGFDAEGCFILTDLHEQSPDIARGVSRDAEIGAGDQGIFYGFACDETPTLMPATIHYAHRLTETLAAVRHSGRLPWLRPDGKAQVTFEIGADGRPAVLRSLVLSAQHDPKIDREDMLRGLIGEVIAPVMGHWLRAETRVLINPTGRFVLGGPAADTGLTGRKLMVDTYGGIGRHGGGAFSGKDSTKVDRTAAYMCRYIAKNIVAARIAQSCEVSLAFAIGQLLPEMVGITLPSGCEADPDKLEKAVRSVFPLSVAGMIETLELRRPVFERTAAYGHFGRDTEGFPWERTDRAVALQKAFN
ncbi:methionine adenosyltransferase [Rhodovulum sulfidophilum]|uniref:methionine adenosyltransferase n=1 Tax=Rhodovulum sulfidophilum TaxID=35806 RepID=UPI001921CD97|nr:methionine adenosyltransferase [Rhodovulum sulfidophilum]MBL3575176.1 methionine adenosyltransferase [Rhodovulum sulfidophilum]MCE8431507.1 methionine adenosyltransferase [Rhodovulum sulfidophilum]MCF4115483.1 methionine adenosyltransferase [Rhodovulum sulfidophilum]